jgi:hypothetical protein
MEWAGVLRPRAPISFYMLDTVLIDSVRYSPTPDHISNISRCIDANGGENGPLGSRSPAWFSK